MTVYVKVFHTQKLNPTLVSNINITKYKICQFFTFFIKIDTQWSLVSSFKYHTRNNFWMHLKTFDIILEKSFIMAGFKLQNNIFEFNNFILHSAMIIDKMYNFIGTSQQKTQRLAVCSKFHLSTMNQKEALWFFMFNEFEDIYCT